MDMTADEAAWILTNPGSYGRDTRLQAEAYMIDHGAWLRTVECGKTLEAEGSIPARLKPGKLPAPQWDW